MLRTLFKRGACSFAPRRMFSYNANCGQQFFDSKGISALVQPKVMTADEAIYKYIPRLNANVHVQMASAAPQLLLAALARDYQIVQCTTYHMSLEGAAPHMKPEIASRIRANQFFVGHNGRDAVTRGDADFTPVFFSEVPMLYRRNVISLDTALIHLSPPDVHGWCSMGVSVACDLAAVQSAKHIVAQINPNMPRTHGDGFIHVSQLDAIVECNEQLPEVSYSEGDPVDIAIGKYIAQLIPDGATLQMGIGSIPNAVLKNLNNSKDLGVHTEMFSDGVLSLIEAGVVNNKNKKLYPGKNIATFLMGSKKLYDFVDDNPSVAVLDVQEVNNPSFIAQNPLVHGINSAIEVDITGQIVADSIGTRIFSGVGGQMDFMRGAAQSAGGKPIIAVPSITSKGESRISAVLKEGAGVVTTRGHAHYVVTEHGVAYVFGKTLRERARALIAIAHPMHREKLTQEATKRFGKLL